MERHALACFFALLALTSANDQSRWSRQISSYTSDLSDWVPLPGPVERERPQITQIKRQAIAEPRILAEPVFPGFQRPTGFSQEFPGRTYFNSGANRQLYLQSVPSVPSAPQNYLSDQGFTQGIRSDHGIRFGLAQPNFPLNQGFVSPQLTFESVQTKQRQPQLPTISNPVSFPKTNILATAPVKPFINQAPKKTEAPKFVDGYRLENITNFNSQRKPLSLQKLKYDTFEKIPRTEMVPPRQKSEKEEVQLLYVPLESLNRGQFNYRNPSSASQAVSSETYNQNIQRPNIGVNQAPSKQNFGVEFQRPASKPLDTFKYFSDFNLPYDNDPPSNIDQVPKFSTITSPFPTSPSTTPKPKKLKPHQPPLAIFLAQEARKGNQVKVGDVLSSLKHASSVAVLDSVNPLTAPKVFIGPSNLAPPENFVKFELPYLSNIDHTEKKIRQLPFFVAPLSYNTPQGFAKIPFPSPHVGSVVINSQIKESSTTSQVPTISPNSYSTSPQTYRQEQRSTQRPNVSFYSTSPPRTNAPLTQQSNYYSFEPQTVSTVRPPKEPLASIVSSPNPESYLLKNADNPYYPVPTNFDPRDSFKNQESTKGYYTTKHTEPTTQRTTVSTTTKPSTYPSQLLETHNPYSINQAFHFSTPLDYHNLFDESYATPGFKQVLRPSQQPLLPSSPTQGTPITSSTHKPTDTVTEKIYQSSPSYLQNYSPEIHHESENADLRLHDSNSDYTSKPEASDYSQSTPQDNVHSVSSANPPAEYNGNIETQSPISSAETVNNSPYEGDISTKSPYLYNQLESEGNYQDEKQTSSTPTTTTTTTTRRTTQRSRGRPRYTTPKADSTESTTRNVVTRRPLRERRPLPPRTRYEPNKITTERATRKPIESSESTTKYTRGRTRGRVQYKPTESDEHFKSGKQNSKEADLAYQRDILHQNYPVTLMERASTSDIEAITDPVPKISSTKLLDSVTEVYDTENAYSYDRASVTHHIPNTGSREETYTSRAETQTETYVPKQQSTREDYNYQSRSSLAPVDAFSTFEETFEKEDDIYARQSTPSVKSDRTEASYATEPSTVVTEQSPSSYSFSDVSFKSPDATATPEIEITKVTNRETTHEEEPEENIVQTTPSYNRVRVRPGVVRQYHQASTDSSRRKAEQRRLQPVTYRPAFDRRRTTMRIEEIEADLKTKQVHSRPEVQDYRHPVYKPESTTEPTGTSASNQDTTTKRGVFRRRRPTYTQTSTEASSSSSSTKRTYEVKNRFRGRRPTDKPATEKSEPQTEASTTTVRNTIYSRYSRPRLSERYNKKQEPEDSEDQDSNYSINRPKFVEPESEHWSPKISTDTFKPYNPNDIVDDKKTTTAPADAELDIITARNNDYDDILLTVTPATNNRGKKKIPDIPPTLEALVEQSKVTKSDSGDTMSTFETMLEQVMKSLEEQDEHEYSSNVMKHKGGEIGEIPPERIISSGDNYSRATTVENNEATTTEPIDDDSIYKEDDKDQKVRRRGFWKKVKVRPITTESIETAESQYYTKTVNHLGQSIAETKTGHDKTEPKEKHKVTTYKPPYQFFKDIFEENEEDILPLVDIPKIKSVNNTTQTDKDVTNTENNLDNNTPTEGSVNPGDMDLGTGSPDPTIGTTYNTPAETTTVKVQDKADGYSIMDYLFGYTSDDEDHVELKKYNTFETTHKTEDIKTTTELSKLKITTTEPAYIPEEITALPDGEEDYSMFQNSQINNSTETKKPEVESVETTEKSVKVETSSVSSFMDPNNVVSTSMSTEISHETEICFRGKCIKSNKDIL